MHAGVLKNLPLKKRLMLILFFPLVGILILSYIGASDKYHQSRQTLQDLKSYEFSKQLDTLINVLQIERGISNAYVNSDGKIFRQELNAVQSQSDVVIQSFHQFMMKTEDLHFYQKTTIQELFHDLDQLDSYRKLVIQLKPSRFFDYYTDAIDQMIKITYMIGRRLSNNNDVYRFANIYSLLISLTEYKGQERGIVNGILAANEFDSKLYQTLISLIAKQQITLAKLNAIMTVDEKSQFHTVLNTAENIMVNKIRSSIFEKIKKIDLLNEMQSNIGYGGMIHHFKNYVIRGDESHVGYFNQLLKKIKIILLQYQQLSLSKQETAYLYIIENTLLEYQQMMVIVSQLHHSSASINDIDSFVQIDDMPAIRAIKNLQKVIIGVDVENWFRLSSTAIQSIQEYTQQVINRLINEIQLTKKQADKPFYGYIILVIVMLIVVFLMSHFLTQRFIDGMTQLALCMKQVEKTGDFGHRIDMDGDDEIGIMVIAYNRLMNNLQSTLSNINHLMASVAEGDYAQSISLKNNPDDKDELQRLAQHGNEMASQLQNAYADINRLIMAVEQSQDMIVIADQKGMIQYTNAAFKTVNGGQHDNAINKVFFLDHVQPFRKQSEIWQQLQLNQSWKGEYRCQYQPNDPLKHFIVSISPIHDKSDMINNYVLVGRDVSHEKNIEEHLKQAQKLEALGRIAGGVAHDFNNFLSPIMGHAEMIQSRLTADSDMSHHVTEILKASTKGKALVSQILSHAKGKDNKQNVVLYDEINSVLEIIKQNLDANIQLDIVLEKSHQLVYVDPSFIHQVMMNLCMNAAQALNNGGTIIVRLSKVTIDRSFAIEHQIAPGEFEYLMIQDNGIGMTEDIKHKIFEPFFSTKKPGFGTGIGLFTVDQGIRQRGGIMQVDSTPNVGSQFHLYFPISSEIVEPVLAESDVIIKKHAILILDDHLFARKTQLYLSCIGIDAEISTPDQLSRIDHQIDVIMIDNPEAILDYLAKYPTEVVVFNNNADKISTGVLPHNIIPVFINGTLSPSELGEQLYTMLNHA